MMMECKEVVDRLIALDPGQSPDRALVHHLESCEECRREWLRFTSALESLRYAVPVRSDDEVPFDSSLRIDRIMEAVVWGPIANQGIEASDRTPRSAPGLQMRSWILGGVALLLGVGMLPYIVSVRELRSIGGFHVTTAVALGVIVTAYASVFVRANLQQLNRFVRRFTG